METDKRLERYKRFLITVAFWAVLLFLIYAGMKYGISLLMPFFIAALAVVISRPFAHLLTDRLHFNRKLAGIISLLILLAILFAVITGIINYLISRGGKIVSSIPSFYYNTVQPGIQNTFDALSEWASGFGTSFDDVIEMIGPHVLSSLGSFVSSLSGKAITFISGIASGIPSFLLNTLISIIAMVFIVLDLDRIKSFVKNNASERTVELIRKAKTSFGEVILKYIKSYFIIFLISIIENSIGLLIIGQKQPFLIGLMIAIVDVFPILGSGTVLIPWGIICLFTGDIKKGIGLLVLYVVIVILRQVIEPRIIGKRIGMRPIVTLVCMIVGAKLFGGIGLLGVPIAAAIITDLNRSGAIHLFNDDDITEEEKDTGEADDSGSGNDDGNTE
ncbi:MAG: sporulation integral membrane protein YtvI [Christensenellaceae bacterium]|nr:sporulation integral membrane protein YtvI [Christensenellaceae bacterium]